MKMKEYFDEHMLTFNLAEYMEDINAEYSKRMENNKKNKWKWNQS